MQLFSSGLPGPPRAASIASSRGEVWAKRPNPVRRQRTSILMVWSVYSGAAGDGGLRIPWLGAGVSTARDDPAADRSPLKPVPLCGVTDQRVRDRRGATL